MDRTFRGHSGGSRTSPSGTLPVGRRGLLSELWRSTMTTTRLMRIAVLALAAAVAMLTASSLAQRSSQPAAHNKYGLSAPKPRPSGTIRIATYNVLNLFDHVDDPALTGNIDDIDMATDDARCRGIADAILAVDADIIALEEVESLEALTWFRDTYLPDAGYEYLASYDVGYYRGVEQSVISRFPITNAMVRPNLPLDDVQREGPGWSEVPQKYRQGLTVQRSPLMVDVKVSDEYEVTIFAVHHKSGGDFRFQREAEAIRTIEWINEIRMTRPDRNIIVMGDFNAAPWDKSLRLYLEAGLVDTLNHRIIPRWKNASQDEANLYKTHESGRVIDYILMSSAAHRELVIGSPHVYGTLYDEEYDWKTDPYPAGYAADHYPVIIDIMQYDQP